MILLTSFRRSRELAKLYGNWELWSAAVYQPKGFKYPKAEWADIRDEAGVWIRPRLFIDAEKPLEEYKEALWRHYTSRTDEIDDWLYDNGGYLGKAGETDLALCCWCPYDRAAQRQLDEHGTFVCHTAVMGKVLEEIMGVRIKYDSDRDLMVKF